MGLGTANDPRNILLRMIVQQSVVEVNFLDRNGYFETVFRKLLEDSDGKAIAIKTPSQYPAPVPLSSNDRIKLVFSDDENVYLFTTSVLFPNVLLADDPSPKREEKMVAILQWPETIYSNQRRKHPRQDIPKLFQLNARILYSGRELRVREKIKIIQQEYTGKAEVLDISSGGASIKTGLDFPFALIPGETLFITFEHPSLKIPFTAQAMTRQRKSARNQITYGIQFFGNEDELKKVDAQVNTIISSIFRFRRSGKL